jgi:KUP system potassium uptake protein
MAITTLLYMGVALHRWHWPRWRVYTIGLPLLAIDLAFVAAQLVKIPHGGWFAIGIGVIQFTLMTTWRTGRRAVAAGIRRGEIPVRQFVEDLPEQDWTRVPGTAAFLFKDAGATPPALLVNVSHNKVLHEQVLLVSVDTADVPTVPDDARAVVTKVGPGIWQVELRFGFIDAPDIPTALGRIRRNGLHLDPDEITYFLGRESIVATSTPTMHPLREHLFVLQNRTAASAARFFCLPSNRVFEVGTTIEI